jgi:hypothetical protein
MVQYASVFSQILALFQRPDFAKIIREHKGERHSKGFTCWDQFVAMLFCQLAQAHSLREICNGLACCLGKLKHLGVRKAPNKSTLSYANEHRPYQVFEDLFYLLLDRCVFKAGEKKRKFRFKNKLFSLDATVIDLCLSMFEWAQFRQTKGAVKLHLLLDHDGYLPTYAHISEGKVHEINIARQLEFAPGSIIVTDLGFNDYTLYGNWTEGKVYFVTRMKDNANYEVVKILNPPEKRNILSDQIIRFTGYGSRKKCPYPLRRIEVWDAENQRIIVLLTNHLKFGATTVAMIYKERWQIEIFFKAIKQNLKIKTFVGTSANALKIQIWTALIAILILKYLQLCSKINWSLSNLVALLRMNLFTYRNLWDWINEPYTTPPQPPPDFQLDLWSQNLGQHLSQNRLPIL